MPVPHAFAAERPRESQALIVAASALQLAFVLLVWLLALAPMALLALGATVIQAVKGAVVKVPVASAGFRR